MRAHTMYLAVLLALSLTAFPIFAEETEDATPKEGEKTVIIKMTGDGECTELNELGLDIDLIELSSEKGVTKIIIKCPEGEFLDLSELDADMEELGAELSELGVKVEVHELTGEGGKIHKEIRICPDGDFPDMGKFEMDFDIEMDEAGLSAEKTTISMVVKDDGEEVTIKARGDKDKLKPEIDELLEELSEDGGKVTIKELEEGYDITIK